MPDTVNTRIKLKRDTTANWNAARNFIPLHGEIIIYSDYASYNVTENNETITRYVPNIKIGTGNAYVQDLPFVDKDVRDRLMEHIINQDIHVALGEKTFWNSKLNYDSTLEIDGELVNETLVLTRY